MVPVAELKLFSILKRNPSEETTFVADGTGVKVCLTPHSAHSGLQLAIMEDKPEFQISLSPIVGRLPAP